MQEPLYLTPMKNELAVLAHLFFKPLLQFIKILATFWELTFEQVTETMLMTVHISSRSLKLYQLLREEEDLVLGCAESILQAVCLQTI